jgi:hypothetical protein
VKQLVVRPQSVVNASQLGTDTTASSRRFQGEPPIIHMFICSMIQTCCGSLANLGLLAGISLSAAAGLDHPTHTQKQGTSIVDTTTAMLNVACCPSATGRPLAGRRGTPLLFFSSATKYRRRRSRSQYSSFLMSFPIFSFFSSRDQAPVSGPFFGIALSQEARGERENLLS